MLADIRDIERARELDDPMVAPYIEMHLRASTAAGAAQLVDFIEIHAFVAVFPDCFRLPRKFVQIKMFRHHHFGIIRFIA